MLILSRPTTQVCVHANQSDVTFPAQAIVNVTMSPLEFFGMEPLSGKLNIAPVGATLEVKPTDYRGPGRLSIKGAYPKAQFEALFLGQPFSLIGNVATFKITAKELADLDLLVANLDALFPALFSGAFHAPIDIEDISGTLQGLRFTVRSGLFTSNAPFCTQHTLPLKEYFDSTAPQDFSPPLFLISALRYLQQADRLQAEGRHLTTFLAERILNVAKALEAIFPGSVDDMRTEAERLKIDSTYRDVFASVRYLRNEVDVGHVSFSNLPHGAVQNVLDFSDLATRCVKALVNSLMRDREAQNHLTSLRKNSSPNKPPNALKFIERYRGVQAPNDNDLSKPLAL